MDRLSIRLLGAPGLRAGDEDIHLVANKALGLLFFLVVHPGQAYSRGRLVAHLWEESGEREGRNSLSVVLSRLRQSLPFAPITAEGDTLCWQPDDSVWVDIMAFQALTGSTATLDHLAAAVDLWRGPFLDGFTVRDSASYEDWLRIEREAWRERVLGVLDRLIDGHEAAGRWSEAQGYARRALAIEPLQEHLHRSLMRLLARAGDRAAAMAQFRTCQELLQVELGTDPDPETVALYDDIAQGRLSRRPAERAEALRSSMAPVRLPPVRLPPVTLPMVGRQAELRQLREYLKRPQRGLGRLIVIQGEAGIGKSRLIEELLRTSNRADDSEWNVLLGHSYEAEKSLPYRPIVDALTAILPSIEIERLGLPDVWLVEVARLLPDIAALRPDLPLPVQVEPAQQQRRLFEGVARFLAALGAPLLLVLEDVHWADEGTLQILSYVLRQEAAGGLTVLATVRQEDRSEGLNGLLRSLEREGRLTTLRLERLSVDGTTALLREMVQDGFGLLGERLFAETEGNPLFAVEMVRSLIEQGALRQTRLPAEFSDLSLPDSVQAVIEARLARLDESGRTLLNAAAIFRRGATFEQIAAVSNLPESQALDILESLLTSQMLREMVDRTHSTRSEELYVFSHDKIRQVAYEGLSSARRRLLHRRAVEILSLGAAPAEERAYHAVLGHLWQEGLDWSEEAAGAARAVFGYAAATRLYQQSLHCLGQLAGGEQRQRREVEVRLQLAQVGFYVEPGALIDWLQPAAALASALHDDELLTRVQLAQAGALYIQGRFTQALPLLEQLTQAPAVAASDEFRMRCFNTLGRLLVLRGELTRAETTLRQILPLLERRATPVEILVSIDMLASAIAYQGRFDEAAELAGSVLARADELGDPTARGIGHAFLEVIAQTRGDWGAAERHGQLAIALSREGGNQIYEYVGHVFLGLAQARQGNIEAGLNTAQQALALARRADIKVLLGRAQAWLGEILWLAGRPDEARTMAEQGQEIAREHGYTLEGALATRVVGELASASGDWSTAATALAASRTVLEELGAYPELARAEVALHRLARAQGDPEAAAAAHRRASELLNRLGMLNDLARLDKIGSVSRPGQPSH